MDAELATEEDVRSGVSGRWASGAVWQSSGPVKLTPLGPLDFQAMACNYRTGGSAIKTGARAYVISLYLGGNLPQRICVTVQTRGGRWVEKWENTERLRNFRVVNVPYGHQKFSERSRLEFSPAQSASFLRAVRSYEG